MNPTNSTKKRLLTEAHELAQALHKVGAINKTTMREYDELCLPKVKDISARKIKTIRENAGVSQPVFARVINVSLAAIKQWERGERKPNGAALKLLNLIADRGLEGVM